MVMEFKAGDRVKTTSDAGAEDWDPHFRERARWGVYGVVDRLVDEGAGVVYWVRHADHTEAPYEGSELMEAKISYLWGCMSDEFGGGWWLVECENGEPRRAYHPLGGEVIAHRDTFVRWHAPPDERWALLGGHT